MNRFSFLKVRKRASISPKLIFILIIVSNLARFLKGIQSIIRMNESNTAPNFSRNSFRHQAFGKVLEWNKTPDGLAGKSTFASFNLTVFDTGIVRVQASRFKSFESNPYSVVVQPKSVDFDLEEFENKLILSTSLLRVEINLDSFSLTFLDQNGKLLNQDDSFGVSWIGTEVTAYKKLQPNEKFLGLGEKKAISTVLEMPIPTGIQTTLLMELAMIRST